MIQVTKTFLPDFDEYTDILKRAWDKKWITNNGELLLELEQKMRDFLSVKNLMYCTNGTVVLQMALKTCLQKGEVITTPFSYVATTNAILWEGFTPVFVDINRRDFNIDADKIEALITSKTRAILATHVYGNPCEVEKIEAVAKKHQLKVIYDGAHAFGVEYKGKSLLGYGDISTCSFHATKLFHTVEGGAVIVNDDTMEKEVYLYRQFGHIYDDYFSEGINGKNSEFHAAMGLAIFPYLDKIISARRSLTALYDELLGELNLTKPKPLGDTKPNFGYYPVLFDSEATLLKVKGELALHEIFARRYFYPSLNNLPFLSHHWSCPVSEDISARVLCLPLYADLDRIDVERICNIVIKTIQQK